MSDDDNGRIIKVELCDAWLNWMVDIRLWSSFLTLTYGDNNAGIYEGKPPYVSVDRALKDWRWLIHSINKEVFGANCHRKVGHSYFSYLLGIERQGRDVVHFHALTDRPIPYTRVHDLWNMNCGFAYIKEVEDRSRAVEYVTKYVLKDGEVMPFLQTPERLKYRPAKNDGDLPYWWHELRDGEECRVPSEPLPSCAM